MMHDDFPEYSGQAMAAPSGVTLHLQVDDADRWYDRAIAAGATSVMAPENMFWGDRYAQVKDPFGHLWSIGHPLKGEG
jgi:PhnB protein